ncbi:hypothetical protein INR49_027448 [Caranx melampygus]|nr:hypothetical protein INR49_027448 [Caranx melampygus]
MNNLWKTLTILSAFVVADFTDTNSSTVYTRGCVQKALCGKMVASIYQGVFNTTTFRCCDKNLCNGASSVHISLTVALSAALLSALWGTWEL